MIVVIVNSKKLQAEVFIQFNTKDVSSIFFCIPNVTHSVHPYVNISSHVLRDSTPRFVGPSFFGFYGHWSHCSTPNDQVTSIMAPAHPHVFISALLPPLTFITNYWGTGTADHLMLLRLLSFNLSRCNV